MAKSTGESLYNRQNNKPNEFLNNIRRDWKRISTGIAAIILVVAIFYFVQSYQNSKVRVPGSEDLFDDKKAGLFVGEVPPEFDTDKDGFPDQQEQEAGSDPQDTGSLPTDNGDYEPLSQVDVNGDGDFDITVTKAVNGIASVIVEHYRDFESAGAGVGVVNVANYGNAENELPDEPLAQDSFKIEVLKESNTDKVVKYITASALDVIVVSVAPVGPSQDLNKNGVSNTE